jgi:hypothetical protein
MTHTANFPDVILGELRRVGGKADTIALARGLNLDAHGLAWELERCAVVVNVNGEWAPNTVINAVLAYNGSGTGDLPVAEIRDDVARIVEQHPDTGSVHFTPRGSHGAGDFEVFDADGQQIALVTVYADGKVKALTPADPAELADEGDTVRVPGTPAEWHAYIRAAATFADATARMEEAQAAGVDFREMIAAHDVPVPSPEACADAARRAAQEDDFDVPDPERPYDPAVDGA